MNDIKNGDNVLFVPRELICPCCGSALFAVGFIDKLKELRIIFGKTMIATSCCRCKKHNKDVKGKKGSYHLDNNPISHGCCAIDILTKTQDYRDTLIEVATSLGWSIGFGNGFLHLDRRLDFGQKQINFKY